ncbi:MAG: primosomal protein N' [Firmicutes bacterium]|nr:primosomal protein N' [Bacillota bacterium]
MIAEVIIDVAHSEVDRIFDYYAILELRAGHRVLVPFGRQTLEGFCVALKDTSELEDSQLKSVIRVLDDYPVLLKELLELSGFMTDKYRLKKVDALRLLIPAQMRGGRVKELRVNKLKAADILDKIVLGDKLRKGAKNQFGLLSFIQNGGVYLQAELNNQFGAQAVQKLVDLGALNRFTDVKKRTPASAEITEKPRIALTSAQKKAVNAVLQSQPKTHLLFGVTGSGKTEVYINIIKSVLKEGKTAILLVPEISLTPQVLGVFRAVFGGQTAILHSGLSAGERFDEWRRIRQGEASIVIGARSAVFAPVENIGVIIIDEEHDSSYKSETNPRFYTHDVAGWRAKFNNCPLILGSATPSLDSFYKARLGEYNLIELAVRINDKELPKVEIVDMMQEMRSGNTGIFSGSLLSQLENEINAGNQAMLFINRRGFASFMQCRECGYIAKCTDCDVSLVYHREEEALKCHFCNKRFKALTNCPVCNSTSIRHGATGTQRVVKELGELFPGVPVFRMDNDTTRDKNAHLGILEKFGKTKPSVLVGTQMIAKGHDFPCVTLVGVIDADMSLHFADYRSTERTYQLIIQVAGRAGRAALTGKVVVQTYTPKHYVYRFAANYDYKGFYEKEINLREVTKFPPFAKLVRIVVSGEKEDDSRNYVFELFNTIKALKLKYPNSFLFCEAMRAPIGRVQNRHRFQILMRITGNDEGVIMQNLYNLVDTGVTANLQVFVEVNPSNLN